MRAGGAAGVGNGRDHAEGAAHLSTQPVPSAGGAGDQAGDFLCALVTHSLPEAVSRRFGAVYRHTAAGAGSLVPLQARVMSRGCLPRWCGNRVR